MHKVMNETTLRMRGLISRRMFSQAGIAALSAKLLPRITFGFAIGTSHFPFYGEPRLPFMGCICAGARIIWSKAAGP